MSSCILLLSDLIVGECYRIDLYKFYLFINLFFASSGWGGGLILDSGSVPMYFQPSNEHNC